MKEIEKRNKEKTKETRKILKTKIKRNQEKQKVIKLLKTTH